MRKYENLAYIHENTLAPRAHYVPYDTLEKALSGDKNASKYYTLLNGEWDFKYFSRDIDCPAQITEWDKLTVPSCWQLHGYDKPYYTDLDFPYPVDPPYVPDDNPVGVYRKIIMVDADKASMENYIVFEGVSSCVELFVNGEYVGFSTVSRSTSEFKVTLKVGENTVELSEGVIVAKRHIHMTPADAAEYGVADKEIVKVRVDTDRPLIFDDVVVRVSEKFALAMHLDTDEANAAACRGTVYGDIVK